MIKCKNLNIKQGTFELSNINFQIKKGEYVVLMGKTGCGKTTILEVICGLRKLSSGEIWINNKEISNCVPAQREIGYVPQDGALFKNMTIAQNIGFALKIRKWPSTEINKRVLELAKLLKIEYLLKREAHNLSGGEKQRVALARALSFYPKFLCFDEPLSALDDTTKEEIFTLLLELKKKLKITVLHISHAKEDAIKLSDKMLLLTNGVLHEYKPNEIL